MNIQNKKPVICNWCGNLVEIIWVHGHGQCSFCKTNIDECCKGETCNKEMNPDDNKNENLSQKNHCENK